MARRVEKVFPDFDPVVVWVKGGKSQHPSVRVQMEPGIGFNLSESEVILLADRIADCLDEEKPSYKTRKNDRKRLAVYMKGGR